MQKTYARKGIWSRGYCVPCIGLNEKEILAYVEHQEKEDKEQLLKLAEPLKKTDYGRYLISIAEETKTV